MTRFQSPEGRRDTMKKKEDLGKERLIWMYTQMARIREFEERVKRTFV